MTTSTAIETIKLIAATRYGDLISLLVSALALACMAVDMPAAAAMMYPIIIRFPYTICP